MERQGIEFVGEDKSYQKANKAFMKGLMDSSKATDEATKSITGRFAAMAKNIHGAITDISTTALGNLLARGISGAIQGFKSLAAEGMKMAADNKMAATALHVVGENAGWTSNELDKAVETVKKMGITTKISTDSVTSWIQSGLAMGKTAGDAGDELAKLARTSQDLAVVARTSSSGAFEKITGILGSMNTEGLAQFGIVESQTSIFERYAATLGNKATPALIDNTAAMSEQQLKVQKAELQYQKLSEAVAKGNKNWSDTDRALKQVQLQEYAEKVEKAKTKMNQLSAAHGTMGKAAKGATVELTTEEKRAAILWRVMEEGTKVAGAYEAAQGDVAKQIKSNERYIEEGKIALGKGLIPIMEIGADITKTLWKAIGEGGKQVEDSFSTITNSMKMLVEVVPIGKILTAVINGLASAINYVGKTVANVRDAIQSFFSGFNSVRPDINEFSATLGQIVPATDEIAVKGAKVRAVFDTVTKTFNDTKAAIDGFVAGVTTTINRIKKLTKTAGGTGAAQGIGELLGLSDKNMAKVQAAGRAIEKVILSVKKSIEGIANIKGGFAGKAGGIASLLFGKDAGKSVTETIDSIVRAVKSLPDKISGFWDSLVAQDSVYAVARILGLPVDLASAIDTFVTETIASIKTAIGNIQQAFTTGSVDGGVMGGVGGILSLFGIDTNIDVSSLAAPFEEIAGNIRGVVKTAFAGITGGQDGEDSNPIMGALGIATLPNKIRKEILKGAPDVAAGLTEALGTMFPSLEPFLDTFVTPVITMADKIISSFFTIQEQVAPAISDAFGQTDIMGVFSTILGTVATLVDSLLPPILSLAESVIPLLTAAFIAVVPIVQKVIEVVGNIVADVLPTAIDIITRITDVITANMPLIESIITTALGLIQTIWDAVWPGLQVVIEQVMAIIIPVFEGALTAIEGALKFFEALFVGDWQGVWDSFVQILDGLWTILEPIIDFLLKGMLTQLVDEAVAFYDGAVELVASVITGIEDTAETVKAAVGTLVTSLWDGAPDWLKDALSIGSDLIIGLMDGVTAKAGELIGAVTGAVGGAIQGAKDLLGIKSPSKVFEGIGIDSMLGMVKGVDEGEQKIMKATAKVVSSIIDSFKKLLELTSQFGNQGPNVLPDMKGFLQSFVNFVTQIGDVMTNMEEMFGYERIKKLAKIARRFQELFEGLIIAGTFEINLFDQAKIGPFAEQTRKLAMAITDMLIQLEDESENWRVQQAVKVSERIQQILGVVQGAIDAITALAEYEPVGDIALQTENLASNMISVIPQLIDVAMNFNRFALEGAGNILTAATTIVNFVKPAIDSLVAIAEYEQVENIVDKMMVFTLDILDVIDWMEYASGGMTLEGSKAASEIYAAANGMVSFVTPAIDALIKIAEYEKVENIVDKMMAFTLDMLDVVDWMEYASGGMEKDGNKAASAIYDSAQGIVSFVAPAIDMLVKVSEYTQNKNIVKATMEFAADAALVVKELVKASTDFELDGVKAADAIYEAAASIISGIGGAVGLLTEIAEYTTKKDLKKRAGELGADLAIFVNELVLASAAISIEGLDAADEIYTAVQSIVGVVGPGIEALKSLMTLPALSGIEKAAEDFGKKLKAVVERLVWAFAPKKSRSGATETPVDWMEAYDGAAVMFSAIQSIVGAVSPSIDALKALVDMPALSEIEAKAAEFAATLKKVVEALISAFKPKSRSTKPIKEGWEEAYAAGAVMFTSIKDIVSVVEPAIAALTSLLDYEGGDVAKASSRFEADMGIMLGVIARLAGLFAGAGVDSADKVEDAMIDMKEAIAAGLGAVTGLGDLTVPGNVMETIAQFARTVVHYLGLMEQSTRAQITNLVQSFQGARNPVVSSLSDMTKATRAFGAALDALSLPSWLIPGSPPPLAYALRDVRSEVRALESMSGASALFGRERMPVYTGISAQMAMAGTTTNNREVNVNMGGQTLNSQVDAVQLANMVRRIVTTELRGR